MVVPAFDSEAYRLGSRIPLFSRNDYAAASHVLLEPATPVINARAVSTTTEDSICDKDSSSSFCEKPYQSKDLTLPITICVALPLVAAAGACIYFWNKNRLRERKEDALEAARDYDYGIDESKSKKKKTPPNGLVEKTQGMHRGQISMDMNLSSPYLLPPKLHESRESLSSLARTVDNDHDPYRPVTQYANSDVGSMCSLHRDPNYVASIYVPSTRNNRKSLMPTSPAAAVTKDPFNQPDVPDIPPTPRSLTAPRSPLSASTPAEDPFASPLDRQTTNAPYPEDNSNADLDGGLAEMPSVQEPPSAMIRGDQHVDMPDHAHHMAVELPDSNNMANFDLGNITPQLSLTIPSTEVVHQAPYPETNDVQPAYPQDDYNDEPRGRVNRRSLDLTGINAGSGDFLAAPSAQNKRISVGMRPLPPSDIMDTEDPEYRANRIRSFYKEYFEDYSKSDAPAVPALPRQYQNNGQGYYEDHGANFMGDAYMDPNSKQFVMPYAQPVTRRAMTPPPGGARRRGPAPPRFRADSALGPRSGSSASQIRPGSSASGMAQRKRDPPAALSTLPNPSKLGDDSLALFSASDFAPPPRVADLVAGRPQSPTIEKVEYAPKKPIATPIVSTFDELAAMPSPHMLRKSSHFTALDFAPPRRFKDPEDTSDAGSIRSNRSGLSSAAAHAVRSGAGRVSRLPGDTVFTTNDLSALKPQWGLRP